jgi:DNA-binding transcriptional regulator LsrR (DeoR family)
VTDIDRELGQARTRLEDSLAWAHEQGIAARGAVGDPTPATAIEDQLRDFGADEVIVVTHPREDETWQEQSEVERLRRELDIPVTLVVVGGGMRPPAGD